MTWAFSAGITFTRFRDNAIVSHDLSLCLTLCLVRALRARFIFESKIVEKVSEFALPLGSYQQTFLSSFFHEGTESFFRQFEKGIVQGGRLFLFSCSFMKAAFETFP